MSFIREGKEPESARAPFDTATRSAGRSTTGSKSRQASASESTLAEEPMQTTSQIEEPSHPVFETGAEDQPIVQTSQHPECELTKQADYRSSFNELLDTPMDFSNFIMNQLGVDTLTPELLAGPTYKLMKGSCKSLKELEYHLEKEQINYDKYAFWGVSHWGRKRQQFYGFAVNQESALDVYSKRRIIAVISLKIVEWHNYKHLDWISIRRDDDKIYKFKEDTYQSDLKRREAYTVHSKPRGFIYQNKDKKNRLMRIDELYKFSDGTLNDVRNALDDRLKGIMMQYLPQTIWRKGDKDIAAAMIQAIDKMLKTRRIMRSLERFVGGRLYEGDFRML
nr:hypothetical protein [Tanacetum cinerariifolium]